MVFAKHKGDKFICIMVKNYVKASHEYVGLYFYGMLLYPVENAAETVALQFGNINHSNSLESSELNK